MRFDGFEVNPEVAFLKAAKATIKTIDTEPHKVDKYNEFKVLVMAEGASARSILGFGDDEKLTQNQINAAYKKYAVVLHTDKFVSCPENLKNEAGELFKLLCNIKQSLEEELKNS